MKMMKMLKDFFIITLLFCLLTSCTKTNGDTESQPSSEVITTSSAATELKPSTETMEPTLPSIETETAVPIVLYHDNFEDETGGWERYHEYDGILDYENGSYRMKVDATNNLFWVKAMNPEPFDNVFIEVKTVLSESQQDAPYGLICRLDQSNQYYYFFITGDGHYGIGKHLSSPAVQHILLADDGGQASMVINQGLNASNTIRVGCINYQLSLYVNDVLLIEAEDNQFQSGDLALMAGVQETPGIDVLFDNFSVFEP